MSRRKGYFHSKNRGKTMASNKKIGLKLLVDKNQSRVVLAESDEDFVDILLSFLTMTMGTIIRLLGKDSSIGCISNLYKSVESLHTKHLQTEACKNMLLHPLNSAYRDCDNLVVNIDDEELRTFFTCPEDCSSKATCFYSSVPNVKCSCGRQMSNKDEWKKRELKAAGDGVFIKGGFKFIITDDLHIMPASSTILLFLCNELGIKDGCTLEERILDLGREEILKLLQRTVTSKSALTDLCFNNSAIRDSKVSNSSGIFQLVPKSESDGDSDCEEVKVKLLLSKSNGKIVQMEGGKEITDIIVSFLTLPLGAMIKLLDKNSSMGCVDSLYDSVETLSSQENDCIKSEQCKTMLLSPKLAPFFGVKMQLLKIEESMSEGGSVSGSRCYKCQRLGIWRCYHGVETATLKEINPKCCSNGTEPGGGYARGPCKFMVTDDLHVSPVSPISTVRILNELEVPISNLVEREISIGEAQVLHLLKASLSSEMALSKVFCPHKKQRSVT